MQRGLLIAMLPLHLLMFVIQCLSLSLQLITEGGGLLSAPTPFEQGEIVGRLLAGGCFLLWGAAGGVWAIINLTKLKNPGPSLRTSLTAYWWFSALSCLCFPFGIFGLVNLSRPDVRAALAAPLPHQARY
jgi:hypothetical protein